MQVFTTLVHVATLRMRGRGGMADTPALGAGGSNPVEVQVLPSAPPHFALPELRGVAIGVSYGVYPP